MNEIPEMKYARRGDLHIAYQVIGDGPLDIITSPGWISNMEHQWEQPLLAHFFLRPTSYARVLLFDKRGTGLSDRTAAIPTLEECMDDIRAVMDAEGCERAAVIGHYDSGAHSAMFAATYPERTWALIIVGDIRGILPYIQAPTLVIHGTDHPVVPMKSARYLADHIPGARLVELPGTDALPYTPTGGDDILDEIQEFLTGVREGPPSDRVLATALFTDIVDSTKRASERGDTAWRELLDRRDTTVRRHLDRYRGTEIATAGDGFLAMFDRPARAIQCALAVRDNLAPLGLDVRAGLHAREIERRGDDIGGMAVHIGARVAALAAPGDVLASSTVKDLAVGSGIEFENRGGHALKGVPDEWRLFAVTN